MSKKYTLEEQIERSKSLHGSTTYGYDRFLEYKNNKIPYELYCYKHKEYFNLL